MASRGASHRAHAVATFSTLKRQVLGLAGGSWDLTGGGWQTPKFRETAMVRTWIGRLGRAEAGATAIEYAFLAALIALVIVGAIGSVGGSVRDFFTETATAFPDTPV